MSFDVLFLSFCFKKAATWNTIVFKHKSTQNFDRNYYIMLQIMFIYFLIWWICMLSKRTRTLTSLLTKLQIIIISFLIWWQPILSLLSFAFFILFKKCVANGRLCFSLTHDFFFFFFFIYVSPITYLTHVFTWTNGAWKQKHYYGVGHCMWSCLSI